MREKEDQWNPGLKKFHRNFNIDVSGVSNSKKKKKNKR